MIYIFVALYPEAKPIICRLGLKKEKVNFGFPVYAGGKLELRLVITGTGSIAAAAAVGSTLAYYHADKGDRGDITLINFGSCAGRGRVGEVYICNKIVDCISKHTFYPDILYHHDFPESYVVTELDVLKDGLGGEGLHDMEAAAVYQAGARLLGPHQMIFIKVISDAGEGGGLCAEKLEEIMETGAEILLKYLTECGLLNLSGKEQTESEESKIMETNREICEQEFEQLCAQLHCSETMRIALRQCLKYWSLSGTDYQRVLRQMREQKELPCRDRREGKKRFGELKKRLL